MGEIHLSFLFYLHLGAGFKNHDLESSQLSTNVNSNPKYLTNNYTATLTFWHVLKTAVFYFHQTDDLCQKVQTNDTKRERNTNTFKKDQEH